MIAVMETVMTFHPGAELLPIMGDDALEALAEDIHVHGLRKPIVIEWRTRRIIDGRARYLACGMCDVRPTYTEPEGCQSATVLALISNMPNREMSRGQRAALAVEARELIKEELVGIPHAERTGNCRMFNGDRDGVRSIAARAVGSIIHDFRIASRLHTVAPDLFAQLRAGTFTYEQAKAYVGALSTDAMGRRRSTKRLERVEKIREMAAASHCAERIAEIIGMNERYVTDTAGAEGIDLVSSRRVKVDVNRVVEQTVEAARVALVGVELVDARMADIDHDRIPDWVASLQGSIQGLRGLVGKLQPRSNGNGKNKGNRSKVRQAGHSGKPRIETRTPEPDEGKRRSATRREQGMGQ